jgi:hypothetical protein
MEKREVNGSRQRTSGAHRGAKPGRIACARSRIAARLLFAAALAAVAQGAVAATYKWVDDKGVVHYSDKLPPEAVNKGTTELSKEGIPVRRTAPALTPEQQRARMAEDERVRQTAKQRDDAERRDRALLASYANEGEIDLARDRTLATIEAALASAQAYTEQLGKRRTEVETRRAAYRDKTVPPVLDRELESIAAELERQANLMTQKRAERAATIARYETDRARWRELKLAATPAPAGDAGRNGANPAAKPPK